MIEEILKIRAINNFQNLRSILAWFEWTYMSVRNRQVIEKGVSCAEKKWRVLLGVVSSVLCV